MTTTSIPRRRSLRRSHRQLDTLYVDSNCQLSNDPPSGDTPPLHLCNIRSYQCSPRIDGETTSTAVTKEVVVPYQYDILYAAGSDFDLVRSYLEEAMLDHLASATGVIRCAASSSRRQRQRRTLLSDNVSVMGVNLYPLDIADDRFASCSALSLLLLDDSNNKNNNNSDNNAECRSMVGGMTVVMRADETAEAPEEEVHELVMNAVRTGMQEDIYVVPGSIEKVVFVQNRTAVATGETENGNGSVDVIDTPGETIGSGVNNGEPGNDAGAGDGGTVTDLETDRSIGDPTASSGSEGVSAMALGMAGGALALLILFMAAFTARRRRSKGAAEQVLVEQEDNLSLDDGSMANLDSLALKAQRVLQATDVASREKAEPLPPQPAAETLLVAGFPAEDIHPDLDLDTSRETHLSRESVCRDGSIGDTQPDAGEEKVSNRFVQTEESAAAVPCEVTTKTPPRKTANASSQQQPIEYVVNPILTPSTTPTAAAAAPAAPADPDTHNVREALAVFGLGQVATPPRTSTTTTPMTLVSASRSDDYSGFLSEARSDDYDTGSDCTPRRVLQMQ